MGDKERNITQKGLEGAVRAAGGEIGGDRLTLVRGEVRQEIQGEGYNDVGSTGVKIKPVRGGFEAEGPKGIATVTAGGEPVAQEVGRFVKTARGWVKVG